MRRFLAALLLLALGSCSGPRPRPPVPTDVLTIAGKVDRGPFGVSAKDLASLPQRKVRGREPRSAREATFAGTDLYRLLEKIPALPGTDAVILWGSSGFRAAVPLNAIRQSRPVLAREADGRPVDEWDKGAGPLLLAWPDAEAPGLDSDPRMRWFWVRGVARIEVVSWVETYGRATRVAPGSSDEARRGADVVGSQCLPCHRLRGRGGEVGPDLGSSKAAEGPGVPALLRDHLGAKSGIRGTAELSPREAQEVASFLRSVAVSGDRAPDEEGKIVEPQPYRPPPSQPATGIPKRP